MEQGIRNKFTRWCRWVGSFGGFPLAGVVARVVAGEIDSVGAAALGGLVGGLALGAAQVAIGGIDVGERARWIGATAAGLAVGLTAGAATVGYRTDTASLVVMGAMSGAAVGLAQGFSVAMRRLDRFSWIIATPLLWAGGWLITSQVIVDADRHHAVFGSSGALAVSVVAGILFSIRDRRVTQTSALVAGSKRTAVAA